MERIALYLARYQKLAPPHQLIKAAVREAVQKFINFDLLAEDITVTDWTIHIKAPPIVKSELRLKRRKIEAALLAALGPQTRPVK